MTLGLRRPVLAWVALALLAIVLTSGCGYDGQEPAYDCDRNPDHFPTLAVSLLQDIEAGHLRTADQISERFVALYTAHPAILQQTAWNSTIRRLGVRLCYRADYLVRDGLFQFAQAAEYYAIAAQTLPDDSLLRERARLFGTWRAVAADPTFDLRRLTADNTGLDAFSYKTQTLARFAVLGEPHLQFAREYLAAAMFDPATIDRLRKDRPADGMTPAEVSLMAVLGLVPPEFDSSLASFTEPTIEIPAVRVTPLPPDSFRIEIYLLPRGPVASDLKVSLWVETPDPILPPDKQPRFPFDFSPSQPASTWRPGQVVLALRCINFTFPISALHIGLYDDSGGSPRYLPTAHSTSPRIRIPIPPDTSRT